MAKEQGPVRRSTADEGGGFTFACPRFPLCEFTSVGWASKGDAEDRGREHEAEHAGEGVTRELVEFRQGRGY